MADYNIEDFKAVGDGKTLCTGSIQRAIDKCHAGGGGRVVCGSGTFLTGSLEIKSNVELHLEHGCRLLGSGNLEDYRELSSPGFIRNSDKTAEKSNKALIIGAGACNISLTGRGELNGNGPAFYRQEDAGASGKFEKPGTQRPRIAMLYGCRNVLIEGLSCIDSACWTFWLMKCESVNIRGLRISGNRRMRNNDGIDIDACRNVAVSDCIMDTEDDCIAVRSIQNMYDEPVACENITVTNCIMKTGCNGIRIGCPCDSVIRNCVFSNLVIEGCNGIAIQNPSRYFSEGSRESAVIHDLVFSNITVSCSHHPVQIYVEEGICLKRLSDLTFSNFRARSSGPLLVQGSSGTIIRRVRFDSMSIETTGDNAIVCRNCEEVSFNGLSVSSLGER